MTTRFTTDLITNEWKNALKYANIEMIQGIRKSGRKTGEGG